MGKHPFSPLRLIPIRSDRQPHRATQKEDGHNLGKTFHGTMARRAPAWSIPIPTFPKPMLLPLATSTRWQTGQRAAGDHQEAQNFQLPWEVGGRGEPSLVWPVSSRSSDGRIRCWRTLVAWSSGISARRSAAHETKRKATTAAHGTETSLVMNRKLPGSLLGCNWLYRAVSKKTPAALTPATPDCNRLPTAGGFIPWLAAGTGFPEIPTGDH